MASEVFRRVNHEKEFSIRTYRDYELRRNCRISQSKSSLDDFSLNECDEVQSRAFISIFRKAVESLKQIQTETC